MKGIILYYSQYGSTREYCEWLSQSAGFELAPLSQPPRDWSAYQWVILASCVQTEKVSRAAAMRSLWPHIRSKHTALLLTSGTPDEDYAKKVVQRSLPAEITASLRVFSLGGRYSLSRLSWFQRTLIRLIAPLLPNPEARQGMLTDKDSMSREQLDPVLEYIRSRG